MYSVFFHLVSLNRCAYAYWHINASHVYVYGYVSGCGYDTATSLRRSGTFNSKSGLGL